MRFGSLPIAALNCSNTCWSCSLITRGFRVHVTQTRTTHMSSIFSMSPREGVCTPIFDTYFIPLLSILPTREVNDGHHWDPEGGRVMSAPYEQSVGEYHRAPYSERLTHNYSWICGIGKEGYSLRFRINICPAKFCVDSEIDVGSEYSACTKEHAYFSATFA